MSEHAREFAYTRNDFAFLRRIAQERTGIVVGDDKFDMFYARLSRRVRKLGLRTFQEYCERVRDDRDGSELLELVNAITTNLTAFFREGHHFEYLARHLVPEHLARHPRAQPLRVWSAGCSTGEEPYSIAMTLLESLPGHRAADAQILATDIDSNVLAKAAGGVYAKDRVSGLAAARLRRWFLRGRGEQGVARRRLDDASAVHHGHPVGDRRGDAEVVGDQEHGHAELPPQRVEQLQDFRLRGDVERRGRLVRDQQPRLGGERHREERALLHAAAQLVGVLAQQPIGVGQAHHDEQVARARPRGRAARRGVRLDGLGEMRADGQHRIQVGGGLLEHHADSAPAQRAQALRRKRPDIVAREQDAARGVHRGGRLGQQPQERERRHGLAAARFPDEGERLAGRDRERHVVDRACRAVARREGDREAADVEQRGHGALGSSRARNPSPSRVNASTVVTSARLALATTHGAVRRTNWPSAMMLPQDGVGWGTPTPR